MHRAYIVYNPLSFKFKSKKTAWYTVAALVCLSMIGNIWIMFFLENDGVVQQQADMKYCGVKNSLNHIYYHMTFVYACLVMLMPMLIIFVSNSLIVAKLMSKKKHKLVTNVSKEKKVKAKKNIKPKTNEREAKSSIISNYKIKPYYMTLNQVIIKVNENADCSKKITKTLVLISLTNALLNLPYFVLWALDYWQLAEILAKRNDSSFQTYSFKIGELLYLMSFGVTFYVFYASGSVFRRQIKYSCNEAICFSIFFFNYKF